MAYCINYDFNYTQRQVERRKESPVSCAKLMENFFELAETLPCDCKFQLPPRSYPSPVLYLLETELDEACKTEIFPERETGSNNKQTDAETNENQDTENEKNSDENSGEFVYIDNCPRCADLGHPCSPVLKQDKNKEICEYQFRKAKRKKQEEAFVKIKNTPLILHTFKKFLNIPQIKEYIVVVANRDIKLAKKILFPLSKKIKIVCGGDTRAESVRKGLSNISQNLQWVLIHDVARPFINRKDIIYILQKAQELKCCVFGKKITNALKSISQDNKKYNCRQSRYNRNCS